MSFRPVLFQSRSIALVITGLAFLPIAKSDAPPHYNEHQTFTPSFCQTGKEIWSTALCWEVTGGVLGFLLLVLLAIPLSLLISHHLTKRRLQNTYDTFAPAQRARAREIFKKAEEAPETLTPAQRLAVEGKQAWKDSGSIRGGYGGNSGSSGGGGGEVGWEARKGDEKGLWDHEGKSHSAGGSVDMARYPTPPPVFQAIAPGQGVYPPKSEQSYPPPPQTRKPLSRAGSLEAMGNSNAATTHHGPRTSDIYPPGPHPYSHSRAPTYETLPQIISSVANFSFDSRPLSGSSSLSSPMSPPSPAIIPTLQVPAPLVPRRSQSQSELPTQGHPGHGQFTHGSGSGSSSNGIFQFPVPPMTGPPELLDRPLGQVLGYHLPVRLMARRALSIDTTSLDGGIPQPRQTPVQVDTPGVQRTASAPPAETPSVRPTNGRSTSEGSPTIRVPSAALTRPSPTYSVRSFDSGILSAKPLMDSLQRSEASIVASSRDGSARTALAPTIAHERSSSGSRQSGTRSPLSQPPAGPPPGPSHPSLSKLHKTTSSTSLSSVRSSGSGRSKYLDKKDIQKGMSVGPAWHRERMRAASGSGPGLAAP